MSIENKKDLIIDLYKQKHGTVYIAKQTGYSVSYIWKKLKDWDVPIWSHHEIASKYSFNEHFFDCIDTEEKAYWLGFIYADGYITKGHLRNGLGIAISIKDIDHLKKFKEAIKATNPIRIYTSKTGFKENTQYCRLVLHSKTLCDAAIKQGVVEHKTNILKPPPFLPDELKHHFIRGYIDGDGCIACSHIKKKTMVSLGYTVKILGTEQILDFIKKFVEDHEITKIKRYYKRKPEHIVQSLEITGNRKAKQFLDYIYKDATVYLERKHQRYCDLAELLNSRDAAKAAKVKSPKLLEGSGSNQI